MFSLSLPFLLIRRSPDNKLRSHTDLLDQLALGEVNPPSTRSYLSQGFHIAPCDSYCAGKYSTKAKRKHLFLWDSSQRLSWISIKVSGKRPLTEIILAIVLFVAQLPQEEQPQALNLTAAHPSRFTSCPLSSVTIKIAVRIFHSRL